MRGEYASTRAEFWPLATNPPTTTISPRRTVAATSPRGTGIVAPRRHWGACALATVVQTRTASTARNASRPGDVRATVNRMDTSGAMMLITMVVRATSRSLVAVTLALVTVPVGCAEEPTRATRAAGAPGAGAPRPLDGRALRARTGLALVAAGRPPFVLDVDRGSVARVRGIPPTTKGIPTVVPVGGRGAAIVVPSGIYGLASRHAAAAELGPGRAVAPSAKGDAVWILGDRRPRCTIRSVTLTGRTTLRGRPFPCAATLGPAAGRGIVVNRTVLYDPATARVLLRAPAGVVAAAGRTLVLAGPGRRFTLLDSVTGRLRRVRWPSILASADAPAAAPGGRFVALGFATPSWAGGGRQVLDVWLLDAVSGELRQVPGMPAFVSLKQTNMSWTRDGRLVFLAHSAGRDLVAIWRPGARRLAVKAVRLPARAGSDSFAPIG